MGKYLDRVRQAAQNDPGLTKGFASGGSFSVEPGTVMTWEGPDGKRCGPAVVDFVHTDEDGTPWAFCTTPEGWCAINLRYATNIDWGQNRPPNTLAK